MDHMSLSSDALHVLDCIQRWVSLKGCHEKRFPTICDLGTHVDGIFLTEFPASRVRKAIGELFGAGIIDVYTPSEYDVNGPQWRITTHEQRRIL